MTHHGSCLCGAGSDVIEGIGSWEVLSGESGTGKIDRSGYGITLLAQLTPNCGQPVPAARPILAART